MIISRARDGFRNGANAIATVVSTRVLSPAVAVLMAGVLAGGWRIVRTLGTRIVKLRPVHGFAAETGAAAVLPATAHIGLAVSTTHTITSSIMGVRAVKRLSAVRWGVTTKILYAWIFTLPGAALAAVVLYELLSRI